MNRLAIATALSAAVIGITAGAVTGVQSGDDAPQASDASSDPTSDPTSGPTSSAPDRKDADRQASGTATPSSDPSAADDLLWMTPTEIHAGDEVVRLSEKLANASSLEQIRHGWLVVVDTSPQEPARSAYRVDEDGTVTRVLDFLGGWDVDEAGERIIAMPNPALRPAGYAIVDLATGAQDVVVNRPKPGARTPNGDAFLAADGDPVTSWFDEDSLTLFRSDESSGTDLPVADGLVDVHTSADARYFVGTLGPGGEAEPCVHSGLVDQPDGNSWEVCGVTTPTHPFSADGDRMVLFADHLQTGHPGTVMLNNVRTGKALGELTTPDDLVTDAVVAGEKVLVRSATDADDTGGSVLRLCDLDSDCEEIERTDGRIVLGAPH